MKIYLQQKSPGSTRQPITACPIELSDRPTTAGTLISSIVRTIVLAYNESIDDNQTDPDADRHANPMTDSQINDLAETGRIAFGFVYNNRKEDPQKAIENALQCHEDGIFKIFLNGNPLGSNESRIEVTDGDTLTIVRLTLLSGRMW